MVRRGRAAEGNDITHKILGAAFMVHTALGPGLLESAYESCLAFELTRRGMTVERQKTLPVQYGNIQVDAGYRIDLLVDDSVIVEVKSVREVAPIHQAQLLTYLILSKKTVGLLLNFNVVHLKEGGICRMVNGHRDDPHSADLGVLGGRH